MNSQATDFDSDEAEAAQLQKGIPAFKDEHLYFAEGDVRDVYLARTAAIEEPFITKLVRCNPLNDSEAVLEARAPLFGVTRTGAVMLLSAEGPISTDWSARSFLPFGPRQLDWFTQIAEFGEVKTF